DQIAVLVVGRTDLGDDIGLGVDRGVHHHDLDAGGGGGISGSDKTFRVARVQNQDVDATRHHVLDVGDLLGHVVLAIGAGHLAAGLLGLILRSGDLGGKIGR